MRRVATAAYIGLRPNNNREHRVANPDGKPYAAAEVELIKRLTSRGKAASSGQGEAAKNPLQ